MMIEPNQQPTLPILRKQICDKNPLKKINTKFEELMGRYLPRSKIIRISHVHLIFSTRY